METQSIQVELSELDLHYSHYRLHNEEQVNRIRESLERHGQLHAVVLQKQCGQYRILDGFKRYHALLYMGKSRIDSKVLELDDAQCKVIIYSSNKTHQRLLDYEEAMLVKSLVLENGLSQDSISKLLGMSRSWVCRRLSLLERLDQHLIDDLKLGVISSSQARELIKLPRGNQEQFCKLIIENNFTSREGSILINSYLEATTPQQQAWILEHPKKVIERQSGKTYQDDLRLTEAGNRLLIAIRSAINAIHILMGHLIKDKVFLLSLEDKNLLAGPLQVIAEKQPILQKQIAEFQ